MRGKPHMPDLPHGDTEGPAHHQHTHGCGKLLAAEPVRHHLGEIDGADDETDTAGDAPQGQHAEPLGDRSNRPARRQRKEANGDQGAVRQVAARVANRQRQHQPGQHEKADQGADLGVAEAQLRDQ